MADKLSTIAADLSTSSLISSWLTASHSASIRDSIKLMADASTLSLNNYSGLTNYHLDIAKALSVNSPISVEDWNTRLYLEPKISAVESEIVRLRRNVDEQTRALLTEKASGKKKEQQINQLEDALRELGEKQRLAHLLSRVGEPAQQRLLDSEEFRLEFSQDTSRDAYVLSIDLRRSTELMLKARQPKLFAQFMITLATGLRQVILNNFGVFDKFTGDGVLAFFPEFYSGEDAGYLALKSASECHELFNEVYKAHRHCFAAVLKDAGLGIGLDFGSVQMVQIGGDFTVVGTPVVYACRMSGAVAGTTFANQPAFERLFEDFSEYCDFEETELEIKHEGRTLAHRARLNGKAYRFSQPLWLRVDGDQSASEA